MCVQWPAGRTTWLSPLKSPRQLSPFPSFPFGCQPPLATSLNLSITTNIPVVFLLYNSAPFFRVLSLSNDVPYPVRLVSYAPGTWACGCIELPTKGKLVEPFEFTCFKTDSADVSLARKFLTPFLEALSTCQLQVSPIKILHLRDLWYIGRNQHLHTNFYSQIHPIMGWPGPFSSQRSTLTISMSQSQAGRGGWAAYAC